MVNYSTYIPENLGSLQYGRINRVIGDEELKGILSRLIGTTGNSILKTAMA